MKSQVPVVHVCATTYPKPLCVLRLCWVVVLARDLAHKRNKRIENERVFFPCARIRLKTSKHQKRGGEGKVSKHQKREGEGNVSKHQKREGEGKVSKHQKREGE